MAVVLPEGRQSFTTSAGAPLVGGKLHTYQPGTLINKATYTDQTGSTPNTNPVIADARGEMTVYWDGPYDVVLRDSSDNLIWGPLRVETPETAGEAADLETRLANTANAAQGAAMVGFNASLAYAASSIGGALRGRAISVKDYPYSAVGDGVADDAGAINTAIGALSAGGVVLFPPGTYKVNSQIIVTSKVKLIGQGFSEENGTGASFRGVSNILRGFAGASATVLVSGDDCGLDQIDFDNNVQGTGECVQVTGSRCDIGVISTRNSGGDGLRIGKTDSGVSSINANAWSARKIITCGNAGAGFRIDDTNTTTSLSYPLGLANANAGYCGLVDARSNGTDGLQLGNCNDNVFSMVVSQSNTGCGIRFKTDGTNSGPRCNHILGNDCELNTGNDIQIDAATLPAAAPGLYNVVVGNRSVAVVSRIVDNSTGSLVSQWIANLAFRGYHFGSDVNALSTSGDAGFNAYVGANNSPARFYGVASGAADSIARISVHKAGGSQTDGFEVNQNAVCQPLNDHIAVTYSASITIDASTGHQFQINVTNGTAFTINAPTNPTTGQRAKIQLRNTSGGAMGAVTWNAVFKMPTFTAPATGFSRTVDMYYNGANWIVWQISTADVPN